MAICIIIFYYSVDTIIFVSKLIKMRNLYLLAFLLLGLTFHSCISTKQMGYLREDDKAYADSTFAVQQLPNLYRLQVGDMLSINIKSNEPTLAAYFSVQDDGDGGGNSQNQMRTQSEQGLYFNGYTVDVHGNIRIPIIGDMNVLGYTTTEVRKRLEELLLDQYLTSAADLFVTVKLGGFRYVTAGEIGSTGTQVLYRDQVNIVEALANAGDIPITGDKQNIMIVRQFPEGKKIFYVDVTTDDIMYSPNFYIQPNDMIVVKPLPQKALGTGTTGLQTFTTVFSVLSVLTSSILLINNL